MVFASRARSACRSLAGILALAVGLSPAPNVQAQDRGVLAGTMPSSDWRALNVDPASQQSERQRASQALPRSSFADRVLALTRGRVQLEGGYTFVRDRFAGVPRSEHLFPDMLLRVGLTERFELRLGWAGYVARSYDRDVAGAPRQRSPRSDRRFHA